MKHIKFLIGVLAYALLFKLGSLLRLDILFVVMGMYAFAVTIVLLWIINYKKSYEKPKHIWGSFTDSGDDLIPTDPSAVNVQSGGKEERPTPSGD